MTEHRALRRLGARRVSTCEVPVIFDPPTARSLLSHLFACVSGYAVYRETSFPSGCYLLTGTGVVPPDAFTLAGGDEVRISIEGIGMLRNVVG